MNITQESEDYYKKVKLIDKGVNVELDYNFDPRYIAGYDPYEDDMCNANSNLKSKLKTTPSVGLTMIDKTFRINWSKVFKKGWLIWKN